MPTLAWACSLSIASLAAVGLLFATGCGKQPASSAGPKNPKPDKPAQAASSPAKSPETVADGKPGTRVGEDSKAQASSEGREFAQQLQKALASGELKQVNELIAWPVLLERSTMGIDQAPPQLRTQFIERAVRQAEDPERSFAAKLLKTIKDGGKLELLRVHQLSGAPAVLFRLERKDGGIGYLDFILGRNGKVPPRAVDIDAAQDGQLLSATTYEAYLQLLADEQPKLIDSLAGRDRVFFAAARTLEQIATLRRGGNFQRAMEMFNDLPREAQSRADFQRLHVAIAQGLGEKAHAAALDEFAARYPDDPSQNLLSADHFLRTKQFDKAAVCIRRLDQYVDDPYLDVLLARLYLQAGNPVAARHAADKAIKRAPRELAGYEARLSVSLDEKKFADTARLLHFIETRFGAKFHDFNKLPAYADFAKSPEYAEWQKFRASQPQASNK